MIKNMTPTRRVGIDLLVIVLSFGIAYMLPETVWAFIPSVLGIVGLVYVVILVIDLSKMAKKRSK